MSKVKIFTADWCGPCKLTKGMLQEHIDSGVLEVIDITNDQEKYQNEYGFTGIPHLLQEETGLTYSGFMPKDMFDQIFLTK